MYPIFETERLLIRPTSEADGDLIYQLMNTPKFVKFVGDRGIHSIENAQHYIQTKMLPQLHNLGYSSYSLITKATGYKIGTCGLYNREGLNGIDIGFGLLPTYEGQGYAYEAASAVLKAAFETFKIKEIKAITAKTNLASQGLLKKLGVAQIGTTILPNESEVLLLYQINKNEFTARLGNT